MLQTANVLKSNFTRPIGCRVLDVKCSKHDLKAWKNVPDSPPDNPAGLCYDSKPAKLHKVRWAIQFLNHLLSSRAAKLGKFALLSIATKHSDIRLEFVFLQHRKFFEYFFCFHRTLGISPKDLEGFKADMAFTYTTLACSLAISTNLNIHWNFIGSCVIRCPFWLVRRKDDCLVRVLRKSFWIKKLTNKISLQLSN